MVGGGVGVCGGVGVGGGIPSDYFVVGVVVVVSL